MYTVVKLLGYHFAQIMAEGGAYKGFSDEGRGARQAHARLTAIVTIATLLYQTCTRSCTRKVATARRKDGLNAARPKLQRFGGSTVPTSPFILLRYVLRKANRLLNTAPQRVFCIFLEFHQKAVSYSKRLDIHLHCN